MAWDIKNLNPIARFYYPGSGKKEWVDFRLLPRSEVRRLRKDVITKKVEYYSADERAKPYRYETESLDDDKLFESMWDYQIVNWNIVDLKGNKIQCNKKNKLLMIENSQDFGDWVVDCIVQIQNDTEKKKEDSEKN